MSDPHKNDAILAARFLEANAELDAADIPYVEVSAHVLELWNRAAAVALAEQVDAAIMRISEKEFLDILDGSDEGC